MIPPPAPSTAGSRPWSRSTADTLRGFLKGLVIMVAIGNGLRSGGGGGLVEDGQGASRPGSSYSGLDSRSTFRNLESLPEEGREGGGGGGTPSVGVPNSNRGIIYVVYASQQQNLKSYATPCYPIVAGLPSRPLLLSEFRASIVSL
jgi:hypothetical protein